MTEPQRGVRGPSACRGMVTIELAAGILMIVLVTMSMVTMALLGVTQAACAESAAQLARQSARADEAAVAEAKERAPRGSAIQLERGADGVEARVSVEVRIVLLGPLKVSAQAWAAYEPGVTP